MKASMQRYHKQQDLMKVQTEVQHIKKKMDITRDIIIKEEEKFPISGQGYTNGKLLDNMECSILRDTGASKSYMSKSYNMQCKSLHALPTFASSRQRVQVGNGQCVAVLLYW